MHALTLCAFAIACPTRARRVPDACPSCARRARARLQLEVTSLKSSHTDEVASLKRAHAAELTALDRSGTHSKQISGLASQVGSAVDALSRLQQTQATSHSSSLETLSAYHEKRAAALSDQVELAHAPAPYSCRPREQP